MGIPSKVNRRGVVWAGVVLSANLAATCDSVAQTTSEAHRAVVVSDASEKHAARLAHRDIIFLGQSPDADLMLDVRKSDVGERFLNALRAEIKQRPDLRLTEEAVLIFRISFTSEYMAKKNESEFARDKSFLKNFLALRRPPLPGLHIDDTDDGAVMIRSDDLRTQAIVEDVLHRSFPETKSERLSPNSWKVVFHDPNEKPGVVVEGGQTVRQLLWPLTIGESLRWALRDPVYLDVDVIGEGAEAWAPVPEHSVFGERLDRALAGNKDLKLSTESAERVTIHPADGAHSSPALFDLHERVWRLIEAAGQRP